MHTNFTKETCTGTGAVLTLTGAVASHLPFNLSFSVGERVSYSLVDSGGSIRVCGIGTYTAANQITRDDTWSYNGSVVDRFPSTNIPLSGGTHTIACSAHADTAAYRQKELSKPDTYHAGQAVDEFYNGTSVQTVNRLNLVMLVLPQKVEITGLRCNVATAGAGGEIGKMGIWQRVNARDAGAVIYESSSFLVDSTGNKDVTGLSIKLNAGVYFIGMVTNSATAVFKAHTNNSAAMYGGGDNNGIMQALTYGAIGTAWQSGAIGNAPVVTGTVAGILNTPAVLIVSR